MKELIWDDSYAIGIEEIDRQHMVFIKLLRRFNVGLQGLAPLNIQLRILHELVKYADYHFTSEENIMILTRYPDLGAQQLEHGRLLNWLDRRVEGYRITPDTGERLSDFLYAWFIDHTQTDDRKIAAHISTEKHNFQAAPVAGSRF
jgi:hemerythrin-like metal-binding protein